MTIDPTDHEFHGLSHCPFCGRNKSQTWLTCSRPSCEINLYRYMGVMDGEPTADPTVAKEEVLNESGK